MSDDQKPNVIVIPPTTFVLGDRNHMGLRPIYAQADEHNERPLVGFIMDSSAEDLEAMLEFADARMTEDDR